MKLKDSIILILVVILAIAVGVFAGLYISEKKQNSSELNKNEISNNDQNNNEPNNNKEQDKKENLTTEELKYLQEYVNKSEINPFVFMDYSNPENILTEEVNPSVGIGNDRILRYAFYLSGYSQQQNVYESQNYKQISLDNMIKFLKEVANLDVTKNELIQLYNGNYHKDLDACIFWVSDSCYFEYKIKSSYKIDNKYYLILIYDNVDEDSNKKVELTLIKENDKYYFYSSKHIYSK